MKFIRMIIEILKLFVALIVLIFDELGGFVRWLRQYLRPLDWYFVLIQRLADFLAKGLQSKNSLMRAVIPYLTLPFLLIPVAIILPTKVFILKLVITQPLFAIPAFMVVKLFGAIFIKETWNILRPIGRQSHIVTVVDDRWLRLENWTRKTIGEFVLRIKANSFYRAIAKLSQKIKERIVRLWRN